MQAAQTRASKLRFVKPDKENSMSTLWQEEEFEQTCSRELLTGKAADTEKTISVKEHERKRYDVSTKIFSVGRSVLRPCFQTWPHIFPRLSLWWGEIGLWLRLEADLAVCNPSSSCRFWVLDHLCCNLSQSFHFRWITEIRSLNMYMCFYRFLFCLCFSGRNEL